MAIELKVPSVGESITEVEVADWLRKVGENVRKDEPVVMLDSEKATVELPAPEAGVITRHLKTKGQLAKVGEVIGLMEPAGSKGASAAAAQAGKQPIDPAKAVAKAVVSASPAGATQKPEPAAKPDAARSDGNPQPQQPAPTISEAVSVPPVIMPAAERALAEYGLRPEQVQPTGPGGRMLKEDVLRAASAIQSAASSQRRPSEATSRNALMEDGSAQSAGNQSSGQSDANSSSAASAQDNISQAAPVSGLQGDATPEEESLPEASTGDVTGREEETVPMSRLRRTVAERLVQAQHTAALLTTFNEIDMSAVFALRQECGEAFQQRHEVKLGFMSFFVKACVDGLKQFPALNAEVRGGSSIVFRNYYDIGVAVGGGKGLVVPVLRDAQHLSFAEVEKRIADLARRAKQNQLKVDELQGGTFTISNGGVYGSMLSTPIVNPPQSGVLGMHAIQERPVARNGAVVIRPMMYVALTYDHRIVDGREAVSFLKRIKEVIETPARMLLEI